MFDTLVPVLNSVAVFEEFMSGVLFYSFIQCNRTHISVSFISTFIKYYVFFANKFIYAYVIMISCL